MPLARWQGTIQDNAGNTQKNASVEVRHEIPGAPLANIYADRAGATPLGNPFLADDEGFAAFHALGGAYRITATKGGFSRTWRYVPVGNAQEQDGIASGVRLQFNTATDSTDPGNGYLKFNNSDLGSVTEIYISDVNFSEFDISAFVDTFDDGGIVSNRGLLTIQSANNDGFFVAKITGSVVANGSPSTYRTLTVTPLAFSDSAFTQDDIVGIVFNQAGGGLAAPVSFADIQHISTQRFIGRTSTATGVLEQLTVAQALALLQAGDPYIATSGDIIRSAIGTVNGLVITNNSSVPNTRIDVNADDAILVNTSGNGIRTGAVDLTLNATNNGVNGLDTGSLGNNTWYYIWLISNGTTTASLLSTSSTSPTMPSGYTYKYRVGAIRAGGSATFIRILQKGNFAHYVPAFGSSTPEYPILSTFTGNDQTVSVSDQVPPTAARFLGILGGSVDSAANANIVSDVGASNSSDPALAGKDYRNTLIPLDFPSQGTSIYWSNNNFNNWIACRGWVDAVNAN